MNRAAGGDLRSALLFEAARIVCEDAVVDYRAAKQKALQRLGLPARTPLPDNAALEAAVVAYQRLYGGEDYRAHLRRMREVALRAMRFLAEFSPRLVGAVVIGAVTDAHRIQLHVFADSAETLDRFFENRGLAAEQDERSYRYSDGREEICPLLRFEAEGVGIDLAVFDDDSARRAPLSPTTGLPVKRLSPTQVEALQD